MTIANLFFRVLLILFLPYHAVSFAPSGGASLQLRRWGTQKGRPQRVRWKQLEQPYARGQHIMHMSSFAQAAGSLTFSALTGVWIDRIVPNSGILVALVTSGLCSAFQLAPKSHLLYDLCWSTFLPASLALLLLGMKDDTTTNGNGLSETAGEESVPFIVRRMTLPFALASIGSLLGCTASFFLCRRFPGSLLAKPEAAIAAACLSASFVGGSVNFFATAAIVGSGSAAVDTLVSSMAAADLFVMAIYFAVMAAALQSPQVRNWFESSSSRSGDRREPTQGVSIAASSKAIDSAPTVSASRVKDTEGARAIPAAILVTSLALALVRVGRVFEDAMSRFVPGMACAFLAAATPLVSKRMPKYKLWEQMQRVAAPLSSFFFLLLFAAIGISADLQGALRNGPACLIFSGLALTIHGVFGLVAGKICQRWTSISFYDMLVTSNAAIGGPATAATFCGTLPNNTRSLTVAATVWGVIGYAVGTTLGVWVYRLLQLV